MHTLEFPLSPLAKKSTQPSIINQMTADFALDFREGIDINLGVGYVNDGTMPINELGECFHYITTHQDHYRSALNYGGAAGSPHLHTSIQNYYKRHHLGQLTTEQIDEHVVTIGANGATSLLDCFADILAPGYVITADPYYYIYTESLVRKGFTLLPIASDKQGLIPEALEKALARIDTSKISYFYIVTVNNPDTVILSDERRKYLINTVNQLSDSTGKLIPLIFDKAYEDIIHQPNAPIPLSGLAYNQRGNIFELGTFSKVIAPALRIGYMLSKDNALRQHIIQRISDIGFSNSLLNQEMTSRFIDHHLEAHMGKVKAAYRKKAEDIRVFFEKELLAYTEEIQGGTAGFYFYLTLKDVNTEIGSPFFNYLSRTTGKPEIDGEATKKPRLIYIPGTICSAQEKATRQLRLSYGFEEPAVFERAITLIKEACLYSKQQEHNL